MESSPSRPLLSVVMPVYNERNTIDEILRRVLQIRFAKEIIVVDDGSTDGTREILQKLASEHERSPATPQKTFETPQDAQNEIRIIFQSTNRGKGAALRQGFREARGEIVIVQDADLEYDPEEYSKLIEPIERG